MSKSPPSRQSANPYGARGLVDGGPPSLPDIRAIAVALVGEPNLAMSQAHELRFRSHGSLAVNVPRGEFYDFEAGLGGGPLQLIIHLGAAKTLAEARAWLDSSSLPLRAYSPEPGYSPRPDFNAGERVRALFAMGVPIAGTPAETYLLNRSIDLSTANALRYCPDVFNVEVGRGLPALLAPVKRLDQMETLIGVQRTWLTANGAKAGLAAPRKLLGSIKGGGVMLSPFGKTILVGEGVETTLSAAKLFDIPGIATLGAANMARLEAPAGVEQVVIAYDRDASGVGLAAAKKLAHRLRKECKHVELVGPPADHKDFNSAAQAVCKSL